jgi:Tfp pilus assembly protein PilF
MPSWISRAFAGAAERPTAPAAKPLTPAQLHAAVESAKRTMTQGDFPAARASLREVVLSNPDHADALAHYGVAAYMSGDPADARAPLMRAVQIDPDHLVAYKFLAGVFDALGDLQGSETAAQNAMRLAPRDREVLNMFGVACMNRFQIDAAVKAFNTAIEVAPNDITALVNIELLSVRTSRHRRTLELSPRVAAARSQAINRLRALHRRGQLDEVGLKNLLLLLAGERDTFAAAVELARETSLREEFSTELADQLASIYLAVGDPSEILRFKKLVVAQNPERPLAKSNLAYTQLIGGYDRWRDCWKALREEEHNANRGIYAREVPPWTGQRLGKKKILVYQEQGIGDAILALRLVQMLARRGVRFDLWVVPALAGLAASVNGYENLIRGNARPDARSLGCDYASTLFGLISALGVDHDDMIANPTVLRPSADRATEARTRLRGLPGRRIGLAHGGNPERRDDWFRSVPPAALKPLTTLEGISWVNLIIDERPDREEVVRMLRMDDPMKAVTDFEDTAAIVSELDAVISVDSSVAHLACSLGKPVWVLVPTILDWRWQIGNDVRPWWPKATLLRSPAPGVWDGVIKDLAKQLSP